MAKVHVKVSGGAVQEVEAATLGQLKAKLDVAKHTATIDGNAQSSDTYELQDFQFVTLTAPVKGAK